MFEYVPTDFAPCQKLFDILAKSFTLFVLLLFHGIPLSCQSESLLLFGYKYVVSTFFNHNKRLTKMCTILQARKLP